MLQERDPSVVGNGLRLGVNRAADQNVGGDRHQPERKRNRGA
jgi:hypothetical protein